MKKEIWNRLEPGDIIFMRKSKREFEVIETYDSPTSEMIDIKVIKEDGSHYYPPGSRHLFMEHIERNGKKRWMNKYGD